MENNQKIRLPRLIIKVILFLLIFNILCFAGTFVPIGKLSLYNFIFPGRERMPFGENPEKSYNLTINNVDAMVASHEISGAKKDNHSFRIFVIGDSSVWGYLQTPADTLSGIISQEINFDCNGLPVEIYNFGYPSLSILKDAFFLDQARDFDPDLVVWLVTLESLNKNEQLSTPLVENNPDELNRVIQEYDLDYQLAEIPFWDHTLLGQRRNFADLIRLQLYGVMWASTGIDQGYPESYTPAQRDFEPDSTYKNYPDQTIVEDDLALDVIQQTIDKIPSVEFVLINEPILISNGKNSDIRYNYYYPRWAYDQYRRIIDGFIQRQQIQYYDFWDLVPQENFTNSAIHLDPAGEKMLADNVIKIIQEKCES